MNCYADFFPTDLQPLAKAEADSRYFESNGVQVHYLHRAADSPYTVVAVMVPVDTLVPYGRLSQLLTTML